MADEVGATARADVTIAVPIYNVEKFVRECLHSIFELELGTLQVELLLLDDRSTDASMAVVARTLQSVPVGVSVRIVRHERNRGLAAARNSLIEAASADWLWFVDSDDYVDAGALQAMWAHVAPDTDAVMMDAWVVWDDGRRATRRIGNETVEKWVGWEATQALYSRKFPSFMWNKLVRTQCLRGVTFYEGRTYEDLGLMGALLASMRQVVLVPYAGYYYRIRSGAITHGFKPGVVDIVRSIQCDIGQLKTRGDGQLPRGLAESYLVREGVVPVLNAASRATPEESDQARQVVREASRAITVAGIVRAATGGRLAIAVLGAAVRYWPTAYMHSYTILRWARARQTGR